MIWVAWALAAAVLFAICNEGISEITNAKGPQCLFYFAPGSIVAGVIYFIISCFYNKFGSADIGSTGNFEPDTTFTV